MNEENVPSQGQFYKHFKNKLYQIVAIAEHSETSEQMVIYQALYDDFKIYARPLNMFISEVDHEKYPNVKQKFRFELFIPEHKDIVVEQINENTIKEEVKKELIIEVKESKKEFTLYDFLDARTYEEKRQILIRMKNSLNQKLINDIAVSLDVVIDEADLDTQYYNLLNCLNTMVKFECNRLR